MEFVYLLCVGDGLSSEGVQTSEVRRTLEEAKACAAKEAADQEYTLTEWTEYPSDRGWYAAAVENEDQQYDITKMELP